MKGIAQVIYYITYGTFSGVEEYALEASPAANQKGQYLIEKLDGTCEAYEVISLSETVKTTLCVLPIKTVNCLEYGTYTVWTGFGKPNKIIRRLHYYFRRGQLKRFLSTLGEKDTVIAYHSLQTADIFFAYKRKNNFKFILELEEIYQDVVNCGQKKAAWERKVITAADGYILATEALSKEIPAERPYIVINGTYHSEPERDVGFADGKIHCVYAGTFDPTKGGAAAAAAAAEFLPEKYHVHILGFGTEEQKKQLQGLIATVQKKTKCTLTYDGLKSGEEYIRFLQSCQIGLCTQIPDARYTETSFPSKVLVYLANGLRVLSVRIPAVENSEVGGILYYYDTQSPQEIANAIMNIPMKEDYDSRRLLNQLDKDCERNLKRLLEKIDDESD